MYILGISAFYHDSAVALIKDGEIVAAAQEERFSRKKGDSSFPLQSISHCLNEAKIDLSKIDEFSFYERPKKKFGRVLASYAALAPTGMVSFAETMPQWLFGKLWQEEMLKRHLGRDKPVHFIDHHLSHAASAFYPSPFESATILTVDGVGEWSTMTIGVGTKSDVKLLSELRFPHSLGLLYSAFTYYCGFKVNSGEYKLMGLAPYGVPKYENLILKELMDLKDDGSFRLNMKYFDYCVGSTMTSSHFHELFGGEPRKPESTLTQKEMDLAASIQVVTEKVVLRLAAHAIRLTGERNLCLGGGVALNCVANGKLIQNKICNDLWVQPAAGDAGSALGCALYAWHGKHKKARPVVVGKDTQKGSYLGPTISEDKIEAFLKEKQIPYVRLDADNLVKRVADLAAQGNVIGVMRGRMEFGPRALGHRSIIGDARSTTMQSTMNLKIKFRESFRPFAPAVLKSDASKYFDFPDTSESPYMLLVANVKDEHRISMSAEQQKLFGIEKLKVPRSNIPAITHVDYSARLQTVTKDNSPFFHGVLSEFKNLTGTGVLINTSFNVRGEPIVFNHEDAYRCFMRTDIDYLVLENFILDKKLQKNFVEDSAKWKEEFPLD